MTAVLAARLIKSFLCIVLSIALGLRPEWTAQTDLRTRLQDWQPIHHIPEYMIAPGRGRWKPQDGGRHRSRPGADVALKPLEDDERRTHCHQQQNERSRHEEGKAQQD